MHLFLTINETIISQNTDFPSDKQLGTKCNYENEGYPTPRQSFQYESSGLGTLPAQSYNEITRLSYLQHEERKVETI